MDYYKVLGITKNATAEEIKSAYRKLAMTFHPDRNPGDSSAEAKFKEVQEAYDTLGDNDKKTRYDSGPFHTSSSSFHSGPKPFENIWDSVFGHAAPKERGRNIQVNLELTLGEVVTGVSKKVQIPRRQRCGKCEATGHTEYKPCSTCHGSGKTAMKQSPFNVYIKCNACRGSGRAGVVTCNDCKGQGFNTVGQFEMSINVPAGVETGHQLRIAGHGEPSKTLNGKNGDLHIILIVKEHKLFRRNGSNLSYELPISFTELCLGAAIEVPVISGNVKLTIPPNTQDTTQFRLKGLGVPYFHGGKGDLLITVRLVLPPKEMLEKDKEIFDNLAILEKDYIDKIRGKII